MARRLDKSKKAAPSGAAAASALSVLHPEAQMEIAGRLVEMREYGYIEGLKLQAGCKAFLDELYTLFEQASTPPSIDAVSDVMANHVLTVQWMAAQAMTRVSEDPQTFVDAIKEHAAWIGSLGEDAGDVLVSMWWGVNRGFFTRRLQRRLQAEKASRSSASTTR
jgi:hypothetical protein